jgi:hypothetical protein
MRPAPVARKVEEAHDCATRERAGEALHLVQLSSGEAAADHRADGATRDDVGDNPGCLESAQRADMGPATGGATPEREPDPDALRSNGRLGLRSLPDFIPGKRRYPARDPVEKHVRPPTRLDYAVGV